MQVRVLPQGDQTLITRELAHMGHQTPADILRHASQPFACKLIGLPHDTATHMTTWLHQHGSDGWWHIAPGAEAGTVDMVLGGTQTLLTRLRQDSQQDPALRLLADDLERAVHAYQ